MEKKKSRMPSMTVQILIALFLGGLWGLFFGEIGAWIGVVGDAYIGLLQMTVLPYVACSLISSIGRLTASQGGRLAWVALRVMAALWAVGLVVLVIMTFAFPASRGGSFFSASLLQQPPDLDWQELFIPSNPFWSLAKNLVPAVVIFSIGLGVALMGMKRNEVLIDGLDVLTSALGKLNNLVVKLTPIGLFAVVGHAAGTLSIEQVGLMQGYLVVYGVAALLLCIWILPALVASCTPFRAREVLSESREMLITAFVIGNTFVVLPMITEAVRRLMAREKIDTSDELRSPEYLVPLAYPFPDVGRIVGLVFIPFAAWFYGQTIGLGQYLELLGVGFLGSFAKPVVTIPLMLGNAQIPSDIFNLYLASSVLSSRFGDAMKAMHLLVFALLTTAALSGVLRLQMRRLLVQGGVALGILLVSVIGIQTMLTFTFGDEYSRSKLIVARTLLGDPAPPVAAIEQAARPSDTPLEAIKRRGSIRVGFKPDRLPFTYYNDNGDLVGFDVEMANQLATDLKVGVDFVPVGEDLVQDLKQGRFDVIMSRAEGTVARSRELPYVLPYMEVNAAVIVPDHRRHEFRTLEEIRKLGRMKVALVKKSAASELPFDEFPEIEVIEVETEREFFESDPPIAEVLATDAESGAAWTLKYPEFAVVKPEDFNMSVPLHYFVNDEGQFREFLDGWIEIQKGNGNIEWFYDYWILGQELKDQKPRWSVGRNVLGWWD